MKSSGKPSTSNIKSDNQTNNMLPYDLEMEEVVLGALLINGNAYDRISEILSPECFYGREHKMIFSAIQELARKNQPIDLLQVREQLQLDGNLQEIGGEYFLAKIGNSTSSSAHIVHHANIVHQKFVLRQVINFCSIAESAAYAQQQTPDQILQQIESDFFNLAVSNTKTDFRDMKSILTETVDDIQATSNRKGMSGVSSGFPSIDYCTNGWQKSDLVILAARPAMGKTAFLLSMALNMIKKGVPVGIFSLEMSSQQLMKRLISNATNLNAKDISNGNLNPLDFAILNKSVTQLYDMPLYIDETGHLNIFDLATKARRLVKEHQIKILFIDYLQLIHAESKTINNREQEVSTISRSLKALAKELNIPIIALSQLNRGVESRTGENKKPMLSDLRESGSIEQDADMVIMLHRPEYYGIMEDERGNSNVGLAEVIIAKNRNGATGIVKMKFEANFIRFRELDDSTGRGFEIQNNPDNVQSIPESEIEVNESDKNEGEDTNTPF